MSVEPYQVKMIVFVLNLEGRITAIYKAVFVSCPTFTFQINSITDDFIIPLNLCHPKADTFLMNGLWS